MKAKRLLYIALAVVIVTIVFVGYGIYSSYQISLQEYNCDVDIDITIGHLTDTHFRNGMEVDYYQSTIDDLQNENPDMIIFTGDMFQEHELTEELITTAKAFFNSFEAEHLYAVLGNHDYYSETTLATVQEILTEAGFTILINENIVLTINNQQINIIGLDDLTYGDTNYQTILDTSKEYDRTIVLSHEPDTFDDVHPYPVNVMFSGHSHGGQIRLPFIGSIINVPGSRIYNERTYLKNDTRLYISFGLGQSVINLRMYDPQQIEIYKCS